MPLVAPWNRKKRRERERLGHERPGAVFGGPPITVTCECGEKRELQVRRGLDLRELRHGAGTRTRSRRSSTGRSATPSSGSACFRCSTGSAVLALAMFFTLTGNIFSVFILLPLAVMLWFYFVRPFHRRRYRRAVAELPKWELRPE